MAEKIKEPIVNMLIGDRITFPIEKTRSVRVQASEVGMIYDRKYKTETNRTSRTIEVKRIS